MNTTNIRRLIAALSTEPIPDVGFNMQFYIRDRSGTEARYIKDNSDRDCGTVACLAGACILLENQWDGRRFLEDHKLRDGHTLAEFVRYQERVPAQAARWLGLDVHRAEALFMIDSYVHPENIRREVTPEQAIHTLNHLLETGEVVWEI